MQGSGRQLDERLAKALSHPLRQRILQRLNEGGIRSPNELSRELGDPLGNVSYHVRILRELDCVELVRTEQRRGALEHYYRATAEPWLDDEQWARLPAAFRRKTLGRTLSEILEGASAASRETGFDHPRSRSTASSSSSTTRRGARSSSCSMRRTRRRCGSSPRALAGRRSAVRTGRYPFVPSSASCTSAAATPRRSRSCVQPKVPRSSRPPLASYDKDSLAVHVLVEHVVEHGARALTEDRGDLEPGLLGERAEVVDGVVTVALAAQ